MSWEETQHVWGLHTAVTQRNGQFWVAWRDDQCHLPALRAHEAQEGGASGAEETDRGPLCPPQSSPSIGSGST